MVETVEMDTGEQAIVIEENYAKITEANQLQRNKYMIGSSTEWHQILIVHKRKCSKKDIIPALHQLVEDEFFFPIAYRYGRDVDKFFVHCQEKAILKFFDNDLTVNVKGNPLKIEMKLGVSLFRSGHLKPLDKLKEVVRETFKLRTLHGSDDVLNFDSFSNHDALKEIIVDLSNQSCLTLLINVISQKKEIKSEIKTLKLARNNIKNLKAFDNFHNMNFKVLDLTYNKISDIDDFRYLVKLNLEKLFILGNNEICKIPCYQEKIREMLPTLQRVDDMCFGIPEPMEFDDEPGPSSRSTTKVYLNGNEPLVHLTDGDLIKPNDVNEHSKEQFKKYEKSDMWHSVVIQHEGKATKDEILTVLFDICGDYTFFPCYYTQYQKQDEFFIYKCHHALLQLVENDLLLKIHKTTELIIKIVLKMKVADFHAGQIDYSEKMHFVLQGLFNDGLLNLNELPQNCEFEKMILPMSTKGCVSFILKCASEQFGSKLKKITMKNANLSNCEGFSTFSLPSVTFMDLRNNNIRTLNGFKKTNQISEILLDGNPICEDYCDSPSDYVHYIRKFFIHLTVLDYCKLDPLHNLVTMKNYLEAPHGHAVVENFVQQFFTTYDSFERGKLKNFYLDKSIFTMSTYYEATEEDQGIIGRVRKYVDFSRNILKRHGLDNIVIGYNRIEEFFNALPPTAHDLTSFTIDVPLFQQKCIVITVSGVFKEVGNSLVTTDLIMGFSRTFVLTLRDKQQGLFNNAFKYCISNEQLSITNVDSGRKMNSFKHKPATEEDFKKHCKDLLPSEFEERETKLRLFKGLTGLNAANCEKYMTEQNWELDTALLTFITLMKGQSITANDFDHR